LVEKFGFFGFPFLSTSENHFLIDRRCGIRYAPGGPLRLLLKLLPRGAELRSSSGFNLVVQQQPETSGPTASAQAGARGTAAA
jgi:hypothetical protein